MGNTLGGTTTKVMNISGETTKHKTPIQAMEITKHHPGHVLLDSDSVRAYGVRAKPLDPAQFLEPKKVYFLVEVPAIGREPRRVRSSGEIHAGAHDRLERLVMTRRSVSDLSGARRVVAVVDGAVKMRLPKAEVDRVVRESKDQKEAAEKIVGLCMEKAGSGSGSGSGLGLERPNQLPLVREQVRREKSPLGRVSGSGNKKGVGFLGVKEGEICQVAVAS